MKPAPFVRHVPRTLDETLTILAELAGQDGRILAGGQSLVPIMAFRLAKPAHLIDIDEVAGLAKTLEAGVVVMDCTVSPVQQRNLEKAWNAKVLDRTGLILEIFGRRARTREGALQVGQVELGP